jgi:general secretion pathway protein G
MLAPLQNTTVNRPQGKLGRISRRAFTLMEILVVVAIIVVLAGLGTVSLLNQLESSKDKAAGINATTIKKAIIMYKSDKGNWPGNLQELVPTYLEKQETLVDPWGQQFQFQTVETETNTTCYVWTTKNGKTLGEAPK